MNRAERRRMEKLHGKRGFKASIPKRNVIAPGNDQIKTIFKEYSFESLWRAIFISDIWLPNIAAGIKHQYLYLLLLSLKENEFQNIKRIDTFDEFNFLFQKIIQLLPNFPMIEDYVPEADWGEIKHNFKKENYSILYGCELAAVTDYLTSFELMYTRFDSDFFDVLGRSPMLELEMVLLAQDDLISSISSQPQIEPIGSLENGVMQIPTKEFWEEACEYIQGGSFTSILDEPFLSNFSVVPGSINETLLQPEKFEEGVIEGKHLEFMFVKHSGKYLPVLPRRYPAVLINLWGSFYRSHGYNFQDHGMRYSMGIVGELSNFLRDRIRESKLFPVVNAFKENGDHHEVVFAAGIQAKNKLVLVYVADPARNPEQWKSDLSSFLPRVNEAVKRIQGPPIRMNLNLEMKGLEILGGEYGEDISVVPVIVLPQSEIVMSIPIPESIRNSLFFLEQFVGLIDEMKDTDELSDFFDFLQRYGDTLSVTSLINPMDKLYEFRESNGVLSPGVMEPTFYLGNTHGGSHIRFESLSSFWSLFPEAAWGNPRSWQLEKIENGGVNLRSRKIRALALSANTSTTSFFISFPMEHLSLDQSILCDFVAQIIQDGVETKKELLNELSVLSRFPKIQVLVFPLSIIDKTDFSHLAHLSAFSGAWTMDAGWPAPGEPGIRIVFDEEKLKKAFEDVNDSSLEILLLKDVVEAIVKLTSVDSFSEVFKKLDLFSANKPRFRIGYNSPTAMAPRIVPFIVPRDADYKLARKRIAGIAKSEGITPGNFSPKDAREILNKLRLKVVENLNAEISTFSYETSIKFLLEQIEGLRQKEYFSKQRSEMATTQRVDYDIARARFDHHQDFVSMHKNFRYLIEKFVQISPQGNKILNPDKFRLLVAEIDWLHTLYQTSDVIHYEIEPVSVSFDKDYVISIDHQEDFEKRQSEFGEEEEKLKLGIIGNSKDKLRGKTSGEEILKKLNAAMSADLGFTYEELVNIGTALSQWGHFNSTEVSAVYSASGKAIISVIVKAFPDFSEGSVLNVINFFVLNQKDMLTILKDPKIANDVPVWEHFKRPARFNLRPIIEIQDKFYWGPHSILASMNLWARSFFGGSSPIDLEAPKLWKEIDDIKNTLELLMEEKTLEIAKRFTEFAKGSVSLHKIDKDAKYPVELGDYDVLAFLPEKQLIIAFEAKHITEVFCLKDAKRLREKIFGTTNSDLGYLGKIERRHQYLQNNWSVVCKSLGWEIKDDQKVSVATMYVGQRSYWWTKFPPRPTEVIFTTIDLLESEIATVSRH